MLHCRRRCPCPCRRRIVMMTTIIAPSSPSDGTISSIPFAAWTGTGTISTRALVRPPPRATATSESAAWAWFRSPWPTGTGARRSDRPLTNSYVARRNWSGTGDRPLWPTRRQRESHRRGPDCSRAARTPRTGIRCYYDHP
jgi:hypothetical protein